MKPEELKSRMLQREIKFLTSRSGGPGGQNVNKVNTKVELRFNIGESDSLSEEEKILIRERLKNKINSEGELLVISQSERTQLLNKKSAEKKFFRILAGALTEKRTRRKTKPTKASTEERLTDKKKRSEVKRLRKKDVE